MKVVWSVVALLVAILVGVGIWWGNVPHSAEEQMAYAQAAEQKYKAAPGGYSANVGTFNEVIHEYEKVENRFGKGPAAVKAWQKIAELQEKDAGDETKALAVWEKIIKDYPTEPDAGSAIIEEGRILRGQGNKIRNNGDAVKAVEKFKNAIAKLDEYAKKFPDGPRGDKTLLETGRIWQDEIQEPLIRSIETFEKFVKTYPTSTDFPEAEYRLATLYELVKEETKALALYSDLLDRFPQCPWADKAQLARGKLLADKLNKPEEAVKDFENVRDKNPDSPIGTEAGERAKSAQSKARDGYSKGRYGKAPADTLIDKPIPPDAHESLFREQKIDIVRYDMEVELTPTEHKLEAQGTVLINNQGEKKNELLLMLAPGFKVNEVKVNGIRAKSEQMDVTWKITPAKAIEKGTQVKVWFQYSGKFMGPESDPMSLKAAGTLPKKPENTATQPKERLAWNPQLALGDNGYALSGGPWYPSSLIGDIFEATVKYTIHSRAEVIASGARTQQVPAVDNKPGEYTFSTKHPIMGLYFVYDEFVVRHEDHAGIGYATYLRKEHAGKSEKLIATASDILGLYSQKFGPFPYENMAIIDAPLPAFLGGVGPAGLMLLHPTLVGQNQVPSNLLAHELAHQWFGNQVPINMFAPPPTGYSQWLSEGFATYADAMYTEAHEGAPALAHHMERYDQLYFTTMVLHSKMTSILGTIPGSALYRPVVYEKGAIVLHALRKVMGDDKFTFLLKEYVRKYQNKLTTVSDFTHLAQEIYGDDLSWFFKTWLEKTSYAHYKLDQVEITENAGKFSVKLHILQPDEVLRMPVDITLLGPKGERELVPGHWASKADESVTLETGIKPVKIILDENNWILKKPGPDHIWPVEKPADPQ